MHHYHPPRWQNLALTVIVALAWQQSAEARHRPPPDLAAARQVGAQPEISAASATQTSPWTPLNNQPNFLPFGASTPMLLTDGSVLVQDTCATDWWKLTPDQHGSYVNGTWTQVASMPTDYAPYSNSSAVLRDGRLIIEGGEYNCYVDPGECRMERSGRDLRSGRQCLDAGGAAAIF